MSEHNQNHEFKGQKKEFKHLHNPKRLSNESYEKYVERRKHAKEVSKQILLGKLVWDSAVQKTYVKPVEAN